MFAGDDCEHGLMDSHVALDSYLESLLKPEIIDTAGKEQQLKKEKPLGFIDKQSFVTISFFVGGLSLMAANDTIDSIEDYPTSSDIIHSPALPKWAIGVSEINGVKLALIDTEKVLTMAMGRHSDKQEPAVKYSKVIVSSNRKWGFACSDVVGSDEIESERIRWADNRHSIPDKKAIDKNWLLGLDRQSGAAFVELKYLVPVKK